MTRLEKAAAFGAMMGKRAAHNKIAQQPSPDSTPASNTAYPRVYEKNLMSHEDFNNYAGNLNNPSVINKTSPFSVLTPEITQKKFFDKIDGNSSNTLEYFRSPGSFGTLPYSEQKARISSLTPNLKANALSSFGIPPSFDDDPNYLSQKVRNPMVPELIPTSSNISKTYPGFRWNMPGSGLRNQTQYETRYVPANSRETEQRFSDNISAYKQYNQNLNASLNRWADKQRPISEALSRYDWKNYGSADEIQQNILNTARNQLMPGGQYNEALPRFKTYDPTGAYFSEQAKNGVERLFTNLEDLSPTPPEGHLATGYGEYRTPINPNSMTAATGGHLDRHHSASNPVYDMYRFKLMNSKLPYMTPNLYENEFSTKNPSSFMGPKAFGGSGFNTNPKDIFIDTAMSGSSPLISGDRSSEIESDSTLRALARMYPNNQSAIQSTDKNTPLPKGLYMYNRPNRESYNTIRDARVGLIDQSSKFDQGVGTDRYQLGTEGRPGFVPDKEMYGNFLPASGNDKLNKNLPTRYGTAFKGIGPVTTNNGMVFSDGTSREEIFKDMENRLREQGYKVNRGEDPLNKFYSDMYGSLLNAEMPGIDVNESIRAAAKNQNAFHNRLVDNTLASLKRNPLGVIYGDKTSPDDDIFQNEAKHDYFLNRDGLLSVRNNPHDLAGSFGKFNTRTPYNIPETNDGIGKIPKSMMLTDAGEVSPAFIGDNNTGDADLPLKVIRDPSFSSNSALANQVLGNPWHQLVGRANILTSPAVDSSVVGRSSEIGSPSKTMANMASFLASADAYHSIPGMKPIRMPGISGLNSKQIADMVKQEGLFDPNKGGHLAQTWLMSNNPNARAFRDALTDPRQPDWREEATFTPKQTGSNYNRPEIGFKQKLMSILGNILPD